MAASERNDQPERLALSDLTIAPPAPPQGDMKARLLENYRTEIAGYRREGDKWYKYAADAELDLHAIEQAMKKAAGEERPVKIGNWIGVKPARAMKQYMGQFPVGYEHRIHVKEIVKDLRKGGCVIEGELRPNETHQIAAERKIFQIVAQNDDIFAGDNEGTREIWKIK